MDIDRQKAGLSGVAVKDVTDALLVGTSSSRYVVRNYWRDPQSGVDYQVQVQVPTQRMDRPQQVETCPSAKWTPTAICWSATWPRCEPGTTPGEIDRSAMQRYLSITANIRGGDLGRAASGIDQAIAAAGEPPRGVHVERPRPGGADDRDVPLPEHGPGAFRGGDPGVVDRLLPVVPDGADLPRRRAGSGPAAWLTILLLTRTTLNIESFMGSIMCIGVSVSNSVLLSTFMDDHWGGGHAGASKPPSKGPATACARSS